MKNKLDEQKVEINSVEKKDGNENKSISGDKVAKEETEESEYCEDTSFQEKSKELINKKTLKDISDIKNNDDDEKMNNDVKNAQKTDKGKNTKFFNKIIIIIGAIIVLIFPCVLTLNLISLNFSQNQPLFPSTQSNQIKVINQKK